MIQEYFHSDQQFLFLANLEVHFYLEQSKLSLSPESYFEILSDLLNFPMLPVQLQLLLASLYRC